MQQQLKSAVTCLVYRFVLLALECVQLWGHRRWASWCVSKTVE